MRGPWKKSATKGDRAWRMAVDRSLDKERSAGLRRVITPMVARSISQSNHSGASPTLSSVRQFHCELRLFLPCNRSSVELP